METHVSDIFLKHMKSTKNKPLDRGLPKKCWEYVWTWSGF